jgi:hypothetical protein
MNIINNLLSGLAIASLSLGACAGQQQQRVGTPYALGEMSSSATQPLVTLATIIPNPPGHMAQKLATIKRIAQGSPEGAATSQTASHQKSKYKGKNKLKKSSRK